MDTAATTLGRTATMIRPQRRSRFSFWNRRGQDLLSVFVQLLAELHFLMDDALQL